MSFDMDQKNWDKINLKTRTKSTVKLGQKLQLSLDKSTFILGQNQQLNWDKIHS